MRADVQGKRGTDKNSTSLSIPGGLHWISAFPLLALLHLMELLLSILCSQSSRNGRILYSISHIPEGIMPFG